MARFSLLHRVAHHCLPKTVDLDYPRLSIVAHSLTERFIRAHSCKKEPETVRWIESLPEGSVLWDVGANVGAYSLIAASRGVKVVAIEPSPRTFASLCENICLNRRVIVPILPVCVMVGEYSGLKAIRLSSYDAGAANHQTGVGRDMLQMSGRELIRCGVPQPEFIKIDTDGGEWDVLRSLGEYLEGVDGVLIESHPEDRDPDGFQLMGRWPIPGFPCENRTYIRQLA